MTKQSYRYGAKKLFFEATAFYIKAMREHCHLTFDDKDLIWLAIDGLVRLDAYPYATALIRMSFADMTANDMASHFTEAVRAYHWRYDKVPF